MCMKNFIYCVKDCEGTMRPVVTTDEGKIRVVAGYDLTRLQSFVKKHDLLPQDGTYVETDIDVVRAVNDSLNMVVLPFVPTEDETGRIRMAPNEEVGEEDESTYDEDMMWRVGMVEGIEDAIKTLDEVIAMVGVYY